MKRDWKLVIVWLGIISFCVMTWAAFFAVVGVLAHDEPKSVVKFDQSFDPFGGGDQVSFQAAFFEAWHRAPADTTARLCAMPLDDAVLRFTDPSTRGVPDGSPDEYWPDGQLYVQPEVVGEAIQDQCSY